jgi:hypothetical protein
MDGEVHNFYWQLRNHPEGVFEYVRMSVETLDSYSVKYVIDFKSRQRNTKNTFHLLRDEFKRSFLSSLKRPDRLLCK